jgi:hypothetical protein
MKRNTLQINNGKKRIISSRLQDFLAAACHAASFFQNYRPVMMIHSALGVNTLRLAAQNGQ